MFPSRKRSAMDASWTANVSYPTEPSVTEPEPATTTATEEDDEAWDKHYHSLLQFYKRNRHMNVSPNQVETYKLAQWLNHQQWRKDTMPAYQSQKLKSLLQGTEDNDNDDDNEDDSNEDDSNEDDNEDDNEDNSEDDDEDDKSIPSLPDNQNHYQKVQALLTATNHNNNDDSTAMIPPLLPPDDRIPSYPERPYVPAYDVKWNQMYDQLTIFIFQYHSSNVPFHYKAMGDNGLALGAWVARQRLEKRKGTLRHDRQEALEQLNFVWENYKKQKYQDKNEIKQQRQQHDDDNDPQPRDASQDGNHGNTTMADSRSSTTMMMPRSKATFRSIIPGPKDVVYGRDAFAQQHLGNLHFNSLIEKSVKEYDEAEPNLASPLRLRMTAHPSSGRSSSSDIYNHNVSTMKDGTNTIFMAMNRKYRVDNFLMESGIDVLHDRTLDPPHYFGTTLIPNNHNRNQKVKCEVVEEVIKAVKDLGGRFLKKENDLEWVEVNATAARRKVAMAFRGRRK
jgi:hypothetical protein